jgi:hypothetical protein
LEPPKKSSTHLSGYASGFFVVSASFRQNSQNAHDGTIFHHPAKVSDPLRRHDPLDGMLVLDKGYDPHLCFTSTSSNL